MSNRIEPTEECLEFCKEHGTSLYRTVDNVFFVVFDKIRDSIPWAETVRKFEFDKNGECLDFVVYATCKSVIDTMKGVVQLLGEKI